MLIKRAARTNCSVIGIAAPTGGGEENGVLQSAQGLSFSVALFVVYVLSHGVYPRPRRAAKSLRGSEVITPNKAIELTECRTE